MPDNQKDDESIKEQGEKILVWPLYVVGGCILVFVGVYVANFMSGPISSDTGDWGTFGDYVGGLANPIVALAVLIYVYKTFELQRKELKATKIAIDNSRKEQEKQTAILKIETKVSIYKHASQHAEGAYELGSSIISELEKARIPLCGKMNTAVLNKEFERADIISEKISEIDTIIKDMKIKAIKINEDKDDIVSHLFNLETKLDQI